MAGYSGTPLVKKLGIKENMRAAAINEPANYKSLLEEIPRGVEFKAIRGELDFIHLFVTAEADLRKRFPKLKKNLKSNGMFWVSWPKGSSKMEKDLNENTVRSIGLKEGLVDIKVCAVDEDWSALKFVFRVTDRKKVNLKEK